MASLERHQQVVENYNEEYKNDFEGIDFYEDATAGYPENEYDYHIFKEHLISKFHGPSFEKNIAPLLENQNHSEEVVKYIWDKSIALKSSISHRDTLKKSVDSGPLAGKAVREMTDLLGGKEFYENYKNAHPLIRLGLVAGAVFGAYKAVSYGINKSPWKPFSSNFMNVLAGLFVGEAGAQIFGGTSLINGALSYLGPEGKHIPISKEEERKMTGIGALDDLFKKDTYGDIKNLDFITANSKDEKVQKWISITAKEENASKEKAVKILKTHVQEARQERIDDITKNLKVSLTAEEFSSIAGKTFREKIDTLKKRVDNLKYGIDQGHSRTDKGRYNYRTENGITTITSPLFRGKKRDLKFTYPTKSFFSTLNIKEAANKAGFLKEILLRETNNKSFGFKVHDTENKLQDVSIEILDRTY